MAKKHWIYIKRGLSESAKHRATMGECIWLFMHIIDQADWETGIVYDWRDSQEAADMSMPLDTLRRQRQKLEEGDYIHCIQKQHGQEIRIMEWRNPRDYVSEVKNPRASLHELPSSDFHGSNQGLNQDTRQMQTPTSDSKSKSTDNNSKPVPEGYPLQWYLDHGLSIPASLQKEIDVLKIEQAATSAFEQAFGISRPWPWFSDDRTWSDFRRYITDKYRADITCFTRYVTWRNTPYSRGTMSNVAIKRNPENFSDTWDMFSASDSMYGANKEKSFGL